MKRSFLILAIIAIAMFITGCPREEISYTENFSGTVTLLDSADSLLASVIVKHKVANSLNQTIYTYQINCDSTGSFDIYVGRQNHGEVIYLEFSCPGYAIQHYPVSDENDEIGTIILVPDPYTY